MKKISFIFAVLTLATLGVLLSGKLFSSQYVTKAEISNIVSAPTTPLSFKAELNDPGIYLSWLPSQAGSFPVQSYILAKKQADGTFIDIVTIDSSVIDYVDPTGVSTDEYQIRASDNQNPSNESSPSTTIQVTLPPPADPTAVAPPNLDPPVPVDTNTPPLPSSSLPIGSTTPISTPSQSNSSSPAIATPATPPPTTDTSGPSPVSAPQPVSNTSAPSTSSPNLPAVTPTSTPPVTPNLTPVAPPPSPDIPSVETPEPAPSPVSPEADAPLSPQPEVRVVQLETRTKQVVTQLQAQVSENKLLQVSQSLANYSTGKKQIAQDYNILSLPAKVIVKKSCKEQDIALETSLTQLTDDQQSQAYEGLALCHMIESQP